MSDLEEKLAEELDGNLYSMLTFAFVLHGRE